MLACLLALKWMQSPPGYVIVDSHRTVVIPGRAGARIDDTYLLEVGGQTITILVSRDAEGVPPLIAKGHHVRLASRPPYDGASIAPDSIQTLD